jgi:hypothetical protein
MDNRPSQAFLHALFLYRIPAPSLLLLSVGCCVVSANGGRLKLMPCPSLYFFVTLFAASNDRKQSSQRVPPRSRLITNATPPASAELRLVVVYIDKTAATQDLCSALPQFFDVCHWGAPIKGSRRSKPEPGLAAATAGADAIVVGTVDAEVYTAAAWTPWLRFFRCWPVGARREEGLL